MAAGAPADACKTTTATPEGTTTTGTPPEGLRKIESKSEGTNQVGEEGKQKMVLTLGDEEEVRTVQCRGAGGFEQMAAGRTAAPQE
jgi:hypothetical protein